MNELGHNSVELIGFYGGDESHALSAWTSTTRELTDEKKERLGAMLKTLASQGHHTPFEKSYLQFLVTCDTASHIHLLKHRVGTSLNAESARYKELKDDKYYIPLDWPSSQQSDLRLHIDSSLLKYHSSVATLSETLGRKRAKETARFYLTYANQITLDVAFNFRSFMHFQKLRNAPEAQMEIRVIAQEMLKLVQATNQFRYSLEGFGYV